MGGREDGRRWRRGRWDGRRFDVGHIQAQSPVQDLAEVVGIPIVTNVWR